MGFILNQKFSDGGFLNLNVSAAPSGYTINYLLVGGGGGGSGSGDTYPYSGGNGGNVYSSIFNSSPLIANSGTTYSIVIGVGGLGGFYVGNNAGNAYNSATVGGTTQLKNGTTVINQGRGGGVQSVGSFYGGNGGGVNGVAGQSNGIGGNGTTDSITGISVYYSGGGHGGFSAISGLGSYGQGGIADAAGHGYNASNGVVILSIPNSNYTGIKTGSPIVSSDGAGHTILTYTGNGTYTS